MEIAMGAIGPLLPKLQDLLISEFTLENRVRKGIQSLATELTLMHAALRRVAKVPPEKLDEGVKIWAGNVKELSYKMEDIVDAFMVRVENGGEPTNPKNRVKKLLKRTAKLFKNGKDLHRISEALEEAVGQAKHLADLRQRYEQEMHGIEAGARVDPRVASFYTDVRELVGIEETGDEVINMLTGGDSWLKHPLKTVSIVGFGGLGKTTLAKAVHDKMKSQFNCDAFITVSQNPNMKQVFKDILYELDKDKYTNIHNTTRHEKQLIDELREFLQKKRYLIVIDDIWDTEAWQLIKCAFPRTMPGSRLITTTRIISVSEACCSSSDDIYRIKPLSADVSRILFNKRVFSHEKGCPSELVQVSEAILKKCGGIPLAIITIASLLASNHQIKTRDQWHSLLNSIGRGLTEDPSAEAMKKILLFSYYDLPSHLKPCLLYLSIFPEDCKIMRDKLIQMWIAEGFVHTEKQETNLYELGESYFNELLNRNMIQPVCIYDEERVVACRVHDIVLDLICSLSSEENFVTVLDCSGRKGPKSGSRVRRLSIQKSKVDSASTNMPELRSLVVLGSENIDQESLISSLKVLRVLDLQDCSISDLGNLKNLLHLRYLSLTNATCVKELPAEIGKLQFLQTLDLRQAGSIKELPSSIIRLRRLVCLYVHAGMKLPAGMVNLTSLEVLHGLQVGEVSPHTFNHDIVRELGQLTKLRVLRYGSSGLDEDMDNALLESLINMEKLQVLEIFTNGGRADLMREGWAPPPQLRRLGFEGYNNAFQTLPAWINPESLSLLCYLKIVVEKVQSDDIRVLGMLPALRYLYLSDRVIFSQEDKSVVAADAFPCLTECYFFCETAAPSVFPPGAAPRLKRLRFAFPAMWISRGGAHLSMAHLPSLEEVLVDLVYKFGGEAEMEEANAALRLAADGHPNRPSLFVMRRPW